VLALGRLKQFHGVCVFAKLQHLGCAKLG
jgi:hypothetical protein